MQLASLATSCPRMPTCDTLIAGGTIVDGTGAPAFIGDVAISDGLIVAVGPGPLGYEAATTIDAAGKHITPGWTDIHTHVRESPPKLPLLNGGRVHPQLSLSWPVCSTMCSACGIRSSRLLVREVLRRSSWATAVSALRPPRERGESS